MKVKAKLVLGAAGLSAVTSLMGLAFAFQTGVTAIRERTEKLVGLACRQVQNETAHLTEAMARQRQLWRRATMSLEATRPARGGHTTCRCMF